MLRLLKALGLAVPVLAIGLMIAARFSESARYAVAGAIVYGLRCGKFVAMTPAKDRHCSVADVWRQVVLRQNSTRGQHLERASKLLKSDGGLDLISTPRGDYWIPHRDFGSLLEMLEDQERDVYGEGGHGVRRGDVVLDCGANVGVYTRHALDRGAALVVAIEPAPENLACLRRNFAAEVAARRVVIYPKGVWNQEAVLPMQSNSALSSLANTVVLGGDQSLGHVELTTVDRLVPELALPRVDMIKMDIEGSERQALAGAQRVVAKFHPRLAIALEHLPDDIEKIPAILAAQWPGISAACGACEHVSNLKVDRIQPTVVFGSWN